jgi:hypothetical protein
MILPLDPLVVPQLGFRSGPVSDSSTWVVLHQWLLSSHMLIFFDFYPSCIAQPGSYSIFYSIYLIIWTGILPNGFIILFNLVTFRNVTRKKRRVAPIIIKVTIRQRRTQRTESQLIIVNQLIIISMMNIFLYFYLDGVWTSNFIKYSWFNTYFIIYIFCFINKYTNCLKSFYVYTLTSGFFSYNFSSINS